MHRIERSVDVHVPADVAYDQWTQFEEFPRLMGHVEDVQQLDDQRLRWRTRIAGSTRSWEAEIDEQIPGKRIAWHSLAGREHGGVVTFHRLDDDSCRVMLQIDYEPEGIVENIGDKLGIVERAVAKDMEAMKRFLEERGRPTGAWRGRIPSPDDRSPQPEVQHAAPLPYSGPDTSEEQVAEKLGPSRAPEDEGAGRSAAGPVTGTGRTVGASKPEKRRR